MEITREQLAGEIMLPVGEADTGKASVVRGVKAHPIRRPKGQEEEVEAATATPRLPMYLGIRITAYTVKNIEEVVEVGKDTMVAATKVMEVLE